MDEVEQLAASIADRLRRQRDHLRDEFHSSRAVAARFVVVDDVLPIDVAERLHAAFPPVGELRRLSSIRERKYTSKTLDRFDPLVATVTFAFQHELVLREIASLTGIREMRADPQLYAGGISAMGHGDFLDPHIDNSHDADRRDYRVLNLLYYGTPDWTADAGGSLELWDVDVTTPLTITSTFNRLVVMSTHPTSWHSVSRVSGDRVRTCVSNYYFSPQPPVEGGRTHVTAFRGRPEQRSKRALLRVDSGIRSALRRVNSAGFARRDLYEPTAQPGHDR